jgi:hypothetical protein
MGRPEFNAQVVWTLGIPKAEQIRFKAVFWRQS